MIPTRMHPLVVVLVALAGQAAQAIEEQTQNIEITVPVRLKDISRLMETKVGVECKLLGHNGADLLGGNNPRGWTGWKELKNGALDAKLTVRISVPFTVAQRVGLCRCYLVTPGGPLGRREATANSFGGERTPTAGAPAKLSTEKPLKAK